VEEEKKRQEAVKAAAEAEEKATRVFANRKGEVMQRQKDKAKRRAELEAEKGKSGAGGIQTWRQMGNPWSRP